MTGEYGRKPLRLFFDIETVAMQDVEQYIPEPRVASNLRDPEKIEAARAEKRAEAVERAPLDPDLAKVKLITMQVGVHGDPKVLLVPNKRVTKAVVAGLALLVPGGGLTVCSEVDALTTFWDVLALCSGSCVGYNIMSFDLPFLMRRSMAVRVRPAITPNLAKYRTDPITDLYPILFNWDTYSEGRAKKLKWLAMRYGMEVLAPEVDGSQVATMSNEELITYGLSDLHVTVQLYELMNGVYFNHPPAG